MPELPEVECVKRTLMPHLLRRTIVSVEVLWPGSLANITATELSENLVGSSFTDLVRRGKYLGLQVNRDHYLIVHLRMTGQLWMRHRNEAAEKHLRVAVTLHDDRQLRFVDQRKFGKLFWAPTHADWLRIADVGVEPLTAEFTPEALAEILQGRRGQLKGLLLNQRCLAGLGNIYCDESLFRAGLHPQRAAQDLSTDEIERLHEAINESLTQGLENGGTTLRDYADGDGNPGNNQHHLLVYGRAGEACPRCDTPLERLRVVGRGTTICPRCQP